jgi:hypothetical protein
MSKTLMLALLILATAIFAVVAHGEDCSPYGQDPNHPMPCVGNNLPNPDAGAREDWQEQQRERQRELDRFERQQEETRREIQRQHDEQARRNAEQNAGCNPDISAFCAH